MRIRQKKGQIEVDYDFQDDALHYRTADRSGVRDVVVPYEAITLDDMTVIHARRFSRSTPPELIGVVRPFTEDDKTAMDKALGLDGVPVPVPVSLHTEEALHVSA